jgi:hypothetical protein
VKFRKRPVEIEAIQYTGTNIGELWSAFGSEKIIYGSTELDPNIYIDTLEGRMTCTPGWWVIRGVKGELYPCEPEIFYSTYEAVGHIDMRPVPA